MKGKLQDRIALLCWHVDPIFCGLAPAAAVSAPECFSTFGRSHRPQHVVYQWRWQLRCDAIGASHI
jgi:hypothetical protein